MATTSLILLIGLAVPVSEQVIDGFHYADSKAAGEAWTSGAGTPAVEMVRDSNRAVLQFEVPFATDTSVERTSLDRQVELDLAAPGQFSLDIAVDKPEVAGRLSLYFRSGGGWYAAGGSFVKKGWQTLHFSKSSFNVEGEPTGWHEVDAIRISIWRGQTEDYSVRLGRLVAVSHDIALVIPAAYAHQGDREVQSALRAAEDLGSMLQELGLGSDAVEDAALAKGALGDRQIAILAYNPRLPDEAVAELEQFVQDGGKLFVCYSLHPRLARVLGIARGRYFRKEQPGGLAEIRFNAVDIPGLPQSVRQASWNIITAESASADVRTIGYWYDAEGNSTGHAALALSDRGAFFSHLVLTDDRPGKKQMLAALLGHLHPPLWQKMASGELEQIGRVGHLASFDAVAQFVKSNADEQAIARLDAATSTAEKAKAALVQHACPDAVDLARQAHEMLGDAYLRSHPSPAIEGRAFWNHSGTGAYPGDWERTAKALAEAGFNMVVPNMLWAGRAHYPSDVLPRSSTYEQYGDQIAQCVAACRKHGVEVHVWKVNHNLSGAPRAFVDKLRAEGRLQASHTGQEQIWLCPSDPENFELERDSMLEVARKYDVDGLHFDYIRYPDRSHCYCDGCRTRFEAHTGTKVVDWPRDCYSGDRRAEYHDFRCEQITRLVAAVSRDAEKINPGIDISAAVFGAYPGCRESVGQDWVAWIKAGYLDFVCPMDYTQSDPQFIGLVENQLRLVDGRIPVYPGIGAWRLTPDRVVGQIHLSRELGVPGFTVFDLSTGAAESVLPAVAAGAGRDRSIPSHSRR